MIANYATLYNSLSVYDSVIVKKSPTYFHESWIDKNFRYDGTIKNIRYHYKNRAAKDWGKFKGVYIGFIDSVAYNNLLLTGSLIMCNVNNKLLNCYIVNITKDNSNNILSLEVSLYDDEVFSLNDSTYRISSNNIDSMLITEEAYLIQKL
jgi:hypothetical protein